MKIRRLIIVSTLTVLLLAAGMFIYSASQSQPSPNNSDKIGVVVSIAPEAEFVQKIGGDKVKITTMVPSGVNPHTYEPLPEQLKETDNARMYAMVGSGLEFENVWMDKLRDSNKRMLIVNCSKGISFIPNQEIGDENQYDTHVWVSPRNAEIMAENIYKGLVEIDPANKDYYKSNKDNYIHELNNSDKDINQTLTSTKNKNIMVYHPSWAYFCRDYGLKQISVEDNGKEPTPQGMKTLIDQAKNENIKVIFISPQFSRKSAETIASEIGGQVVILDDLNRNYLQNLNTIKYAFKKAL